MCCSVSSTLQMSGDNSWLSLLPTFKANGSIPKMTLVTSFHRFINTVPRPRILIPSRATSPESKQRLYLYRIQSLIAPPPCLPIILELMQILFRKLNITFLQISRKTPALSPGHCPNLNLSILIIWMTMAY